MEGDLKHRLEAYEEDLEHYIDSPAYEAFVDGDRDPQKGPPRPSEAMIAALRREAGDDRLAIFNGDSGTRVIPVGFDKVKEIRLQEYWDFAGWRHMDVSQETTVLQSDEETVDLQGKTVGRLLPFLRSMNTDMMNPLAFALIAMTMVTWWGIRANGFFSYAGRFINFREGPLGFFLGILEAISEVAKIISFTFRLLGNMFAGEILIFAMLFLLPIMAGVLVFPFLLEVFVGVIQAVVFAALTLVFAALAVTPHNGQGEHGEAEGH